MIVYYIEKNATTLFNFFQIVILTLVSCISLCIYTITPMKIMIHYRIQGFFLLGGFIVIYINEFSYYYNSTTSVFSFVYSSPVILVLAQLNFVFPSM